jgi:hypothetical protein
MRSLIEFSPAWSEITAHLEADRSVLAISPRKYGKWAALEKLANELTSSMKTRCIFLSSRIPGSDTDANYSVLWNEVQSQLGVKNRHKVVDSSSFGAALGATLRELKVNLFVLISGSGRGHEENHFRVISTFHRLLRSVKLTLVTTDDYSSFYFQKQNYLISDLHSLHTVQIGPTTLSDLCAYITEIKCGDGSFTSNQVPELASVVYEHSGGHTGLAQELLDGLQREPWPLSGQKLTHALETVLKRSAVLETINRALEEDAEGYSRTALEYREPACPEHSPRVHILRQLGVLQRESPPLFRLCPGAITRMIEGFTQKAKGSREGRLGTIVSEAGPRLFEEGPVSLTDNDLLIVHLSDLHVGEQYRYRFTWPGGQANPNEPSAGELLREDLKSLGMLGRVDAIVVSGDFVWGGTPTEFRRAQGVVRDILNNIEVGLDKLAIIPGNHDIEWNPGPLGSKSYGKPASRESYEDFAKLLGKPTQGELDIVRIENRAKNSTLQILGLDSNRVEGPDSSGIGFVSRESLKSARESVSTFLQNIPDKHQALVWLALHHHIFPATSTPLTNAEGKIVSTMANAAEVLEFANEFKIEMILHGHEHQPSVTVARRWPVDVGQVFLPITSIGAGSFGAKREHLGPFSKNHYYVIVRRPDGILIRSRCQGSGGVRFIAHSDMWLPR